MRTPVVSLCALLTLIAPRAFAQPEWELGFAGGLGYSRDASVSGSAGSGKVGLKSGAIASATLGNSAYAHWGGEVRYTYRFSDLKVSGGGQEASFEGETHAIHYDVLYHASDRDSQIRPFVAAGGGVRVFRGTGRETAYQPANKFALLTKTREVCGLISVGGGVKIAVSEHVRVRLEFRDYITPFPKEVIAPSPGAKIDGWLHDFVPMVGVSFVF